MPSCSGRHESREVAQSGRAQRSGRWGRRFESSLPDHFCLNNIGPVDIATKISTGPSAFQRGQSTVGWYEMAAAFITRKYDTYYFRQCLPQSARNRFNKYELLKSLKVNKRKDALVLSREFKIAFDQIFNKAMRKHSVAWQQIRDAVNEAFEIIFKNFVKSAIDYVPTHNHSYDSLKFIPRVRTVSCRW
jgi:hypothetical protein